MQKTLTDKMLKDGVWRTGSSLEIAAGKIAGFTESSGSGAPVSDYIIPGMANCHSHVFQRAMAGLTEYRREGSGAAEDNFWTWRQAMYQQAGTMTPDKLKAIAVDCYRDMIKRGYTSVAEFHYLHNSHLNQQLDMAAAIIDAAETAGIGLTLLPVFYEASGFGGSEPSAEQRQFTMTVPEYIDLLNALAPRLSSPNRLGVAFHSLRAVRPDSFAPILSALDSIDDQAPIHIHIAEQVQEVNDCVRHLGKRPVEWLLSNQPVNSRWCLVHATHISDAEIKAIADSGAIVGLCPTTEANLGDGIFPLQDFLAAGGKFAIGSDSNICLDPCEELRLLEYTQRLLTQRRVVLTPDGGHHVGASLWAHAAKNGARALGRASGTLAAGEAADLIVLDGDHSAFTYVEGPQIVDAFVFVSGDNLIKQTYVNGRSVRSVNGGKA